MRKPIDAKPTRREILAAWTAILGSGACAGAEAATAPDFSAPDRNGKLVRLSDQAGKVVVVDFWMTTCAPCKVEIPWFVELAQTYASQGLVVIGVAVSERWDTVRPFLEQNGVDYPVVLGDDALADLYRVQALPTTFLLDRRGRIAHSHEGLASKELLRTQIVELLG